MHHEYQQHLLVLDVDMTGAPCGPKKAAFATKGYFAAAGRKHRRGRQVGRVLSTAYEEGVVDRLFAGNVQLVKALQPLMEAAEQTLQLDEAKRTQTLVRMDAGGGTVSDINWLMTRGYEVLTKDFAGQWTPRLIESVTEWIQDPDWPERSLGWVRSPVTEYVRPVRRLAVRSQRANGQVVCAVLICSLSAEQMLAVLRRDRALASNPGAELQAYIDGYDQRGGGIDASMHLVEIVLNQQSRLARSLSGSLQALLAPSHVVVILGKT